MVSFTDLDGLLRPIYTSFAVSRVGKNLGVAIVEPEYARHAISHLASAPPLPPGGPRGVEEAQAVLGDGGEDGEQGMEDPEFMLEDENKEEEGVAALQGSAELGALCLPSHNQRRTHHPS